MTTGSLPNDPTQVAVDFFWNQRQIQISRLADGGAAGGAARAAGHMKGIVEVVAQMFTDAGIPQQGIVLEPALPGYFRRQKKWDMAVRYKGELVAAVEFKSQVGSVGKNINNRFEEALGSATDTLAAHTKNSAFGTLPPFLAYVFVLRSDVETRTVINDRRALFPVDPVYSNTTYVDRYQIMLRRFLAEHIYEAAWFVTTEMASTGGATYSEPLDLATGRAFKAAIEGRVAFAKSVLDQPGAPQVQPTQ